VSINWDSIQNISFPLQHVNGPRKLGEESEVQNAIGSKRYRFKTILVQILYGCPISANENQLKIGSFVQITMNL
jgi:hypothetical protein